MAIARQLAGSIAVFGLLIGCGGDDSESPVLPVQTAAATQLPVGDTAETAGETELMREVFSFRGSGRDPFLSLLESGEVRPLVQDLRITAITYDPRYPAASVAVLRDTIVNQAYSVRVGDELGRLRVVEITPGQVVLVLSEFGSERQVVLRQRRRQEGTP